MEDYSDNGDVLSQVSQDSNVTFSETDESFHIADDESSSDEGYAEKKSESQSSGSAFIVYWSCFLLFCNFVLFARLLHSLRKL